MQRPAFWFQARSKRVAGLLRRTNGAFRGCCPWYSLNCILVLLRMPGPTRRPRRKPLYREIVFSAATKIIISSPTVICGRFAFAIIINHFINYNSFRFLLKFKANASCYKKKCFKLLTLDVWLTSRIIFKFRSRD